MLWGDEFSLDLTNAKIFTDKSISVTIYTHFSQPNYTDWISDPFQEFYSFTNIALFAQNDSEITRLDSKMFCYSLNIALRSFFNAELSSLSLFQNDTHLIQDSLLTNTSQLLRKTQHAVQVDNQTL